jgi:hypothetical protein
VNVKVAADGKPHIQRGTVAIQSKPDGRLLDTSSAAEKDQKDEHSPSRCRCFLDTAFWEFY